MGLPCMSSFLLAFKDARQYALLPKMDVPEIIALKKSLGVMSKDNRKKNYFPLFSRIRR